MGTLWSVLLEYSHFEHAKMSYPRKLLLEKLYITTLFNYWFCNSVVECVNYEEESLRNKDRKNKIWARGAAEARSLKGESPQRKSKWHEDFLWFALLTTRAPSGAIFLKNPYISRLSLKNIKRRLVVHKNGKKPSESNLRAF